MLIHDLKKLIIDNGELTIIVEISFNQTNFFNRFLIKVASSLLKGIGSKLLLREVSIIVHCQSSIRIA
ncbi:hypothetical protein [Clostridium argentinense]|uniref:hypothetical protein n=1 Tax=Clostridium argentinense TaxID=29341 RepID=UPI001269F816|nr:hypothetical protein [Clostridium argentinense]NFF41211.1 hypothetical protein [Clostridium argentinense]